MSFYLVPTNATMRLASIPPDWGMGWDSRKAKRLYKLPAWRQPVPSLPIQSFQQTHWSGLQSVLVHALARHPARTRNRTAAAVCVVAAPSDGSCEDWNGLCPGQPLAVIDTADVDDIMHGRLCPTLWRLCSDRTPSVLRVVGAPGVFARPRMARCRTLSVPWLSHSRTAATAVAQRRRRRCSDTSDGCFETVRIALAAGVNGHGAHTHNARKLGFQRWRWELREACMGLQNKTQCTRMFQSLSGGHARGAVELYSTSHFCLQPPGDTIPRAGIVDALSVGCIPVLFHPAQQQLWPHHWNASQASVLFDWSATRGNASEVMQTLLAMPRERVESLQRAAAEAARSMYYRGNLGPPNERDAVDVLVDVLVSRSPFPL